MEFRFRAKSGNKTFDEPSYMYTVYCILYFLGGGPGWVGEGYVGQHGGARDVATMRDMIS